MGMTSSIWMAHYCYALGGKWREMALEVPQWKYEAVKTTRRISVALPLQAIMKRNSWSKWHAMKIKSAVVASGKHIYSLRSEVETDTLLSNALLQKLVSSS